MKAKTFVGAALIAIFCGGVFARAGAQDAARPEDPSVQRLAALGRLWGAVKYFHPYLAYKPIDWDQALVQTIPRVKAAATTDDYMAALNHLLSFLGDPTTRAIRQAPAGAPPSVRFGRRRRGSCRRRARARLAAPRYRRRDGPGSPCLRRSGEDRPAFRAHRPGRESEDHRLRYPEDRSGRDLDLLLQPDLPPAPSRGLLRKPPPALLPAPDVLRISDPDRRVERRLLHGLRLRSAARPQGRRPGRSEDPLDLPDQRPADRHRIRAGRPPVGRRRPRRPGREPRDGPRGLRARRIGALHALDGGPRRPYQGSGDRPARRLDRIRSERVRGAGGRGPGRSRIPLSPWRWISRRGRPPRTGPNRRPRRPIRPCSRRIPTPR